jgi:hypothetical protein
LLGDSDSDVTASGEPCWNRKKTIKMKIVNAITQVIRVLPTITQKLDSIVKPHQSMVGRAPSLRNDNHHARSFQFTDSGHAVYVRTITESPQSCETHHK